MKKSYKLLNIERLSRKEYDLYQNVMSVSEEDVFEEVYQEDIKIIIHRILNDAEIFVSELEKKIFVDCYAKGNSIKSISDRFNIDTNSIKEMLDTKISMIQTKYKKDLMKLYNL